jgi:hypothetical protein
MDVEGPHHHHHSHTGVRWLDIGLALSALFVSCVSLYVAVEHGHTMAKLVESNSYPNVDFATGNMDDLQDGKGNRPSVSFTLINSGVGPARLRSIELSYQGHAARDLNSLLSACCSDAGVAYPKISYNYAGDVRGVMIPAGKSVQLFSWPEAAADPRWARFEKARGEVVVSACYCSVFDECFARDSRHYDPRRVKECPAPTTPFTG